MSEGYGLDSNLTDIIEKRGRTAPNLEYLQYGDPTTYGQSFGYSEEMIEALGEKKSTKPSAKPKEEESPWAIEPDELHEPIVSLYGKDFQGRKWDLKPGKAGEIAERSKKLKAEIEAKRAEGREKMLGSTFTRRAPASVTPQPSETVKRFDHLGVTRRPQSTPLEEQIKEAKVEKPKRNPPCAIPDICNPLMGGESIFAWNPGSVAMAVQEKQKTGVVADKAAEPTAFWYPKDKQLQKHQRLEKQRWEANKATLSSGGWDTATTIGGRDKKTSRPEFHSNLSEADQQKVMKQLEEYRHQVSELKARRVQAQKEAAEKERLREEALKAKKLQGRVVEPIERVEARVPASKPEEYYRPELPAARISPAELEKINRFTMPPDPRRPTETIAPPWGRPNEVDDRYDKVRVFNSRSKKSKVETVGKLDVDRELRVVRDGGLQRREKKSLLKSMDPEQVKYLKSMGNPASKPIPTAGASTLK